MKDTEIKKFVVFGWNLTELIEDTLEKTFAKENPIFKRAFKKVDEFAIYKNISSICNKNKIETSYMYDENMNVFVGIFKDITPQKIKLLESVSAKNKIPKPKKIVGKYIQYNKF